MDSAIVTDYEETVKNCILAMCEVFAEKFTRDFPPAREFVEREFGVPFLIAGAAAGTELGLAPDITAAFIVMLSHARWMDKSSILSRLTSKQARATNFAYNMIGPVSLEYSREFMSRNPGASGKFAETLVCLLRH